MVKAVYKVLMLSLMGILTLTTPACKDSDDKVISYQEEVKLSDGSMIWVDIKRHYSWSGWTPGMGNSGAYLSGAVEISWDTGFPNVGRKSVFFDGENAFVYIDKQNSTWYLYGSKTRCSPPENGVYDENGKCWEGEGNRLNHSAYLYALNATGFLKPKTLNDLNENSNFNILDERGLLGVGDPPIELDGKSITWQQKLEMRKTQKVFGKFFGLSVKTN